MTLKGSVVSVSDLNVSEKAQMLTLMNTFYDGVSEKNFTRDLLAKDSCIVLRDEGGKIMGFSTQKLVSFKLDGKVVEGVFSGDTIIHKDAWGSMELFKVFSQKYFREEADEKPFYWFLISKGYKTYKILPTFFSEFYPTRKVETPMAVKAIMDGFGKAFYPEEYNERNGVVEYSGVKDTIKPELAELDEKKRRDKDVQFFMQRNPDYKKGNDLVCLISLNKSSLKGRTRRLLFAEEQ